MAERPAHRPEWFRVEYHGKDVLFTYIDYGEQSKGYSFYCPKHNPDGKRAFNWIDTESGTRHKLTFDEEGRAKIEGSILCKHPVNGNECGWHVLVEHGVARDA